MLFAKHPRIEAILMHEFILGQLLNPRIKIWIKLNLGVRF